MKNYFNVILLVVGCSITITTPLFAQVEISGDFVTDYVWRGANVIGGDPAFQPSMTHSVGETGMSVNIWGSFSMTGRDMADIRNLDELDLTISYDRSLANMDMSLGFIHYNWFQNDDWPDDKTVYSDGDTTEVATATYEIYLGLNFADKPYLPAVTIYFDPNENGGNGLYLSLSGGFSWETDEGLNIDESWNINYMDQSYNEDAGAGISDINYTIGTSFSKGNMSLSPSFTFTYIPDKDYNSDYFIFWSGLSIGWTP